MPRRPGRPPKADASSIDPTVRVAAVQFLDALASTRRALRAAPPGPLRRAVLAVRLAEALEVIAAEEVDRARTEHHLRWADVGDTFGVRAQTAQARFRLDRSDLSS
jgi:hypothetical protein